MSDRVRRYKWPRPEARLTPSSSSAEAGICSVLEEHRPAGDVIVQVQAQTLTIPGQRFAVVVTGSLTAPLAVHERY